MLIYDYMKNVLYACMVQTIRNISCFKDILIEEKIYPYKTWQIF